MDEVLIDFRTRGTRTTIGSIYIHPNRSDLASLWNFFSGSGEFIFGGDNNARILSMGVAFDGWHRFCGLHLHVSYLPCFLAPRESFTDLFLTGARLCLVIPIPITLPTFSDHMAVSVSSMNWRRPSTSSSSSIRTSTLPQWTGASVISLLSWRCWCHWHRHWRSGALRSCYRDSSQRYSPEPAVHGNLSLRPFLLRLSQFVAWFWTPSELIWAVTFAIEWPAPRIRPSALPVHISDALNALAAFARCWRFSLLIPIPKPGCSYLPSWHPISLRERIVADWTACFATSRPTVCIVMCVMVWTTAHPYKFLIVSSKQLLIYSAVHLTSKWNTFLGECECTNIFLNSIQFWVVLS